MLGCFILLAIFTVTASADPVTNTPAVAAPNFGGGNNAATEKDHQRMMDLLGIKSIRWGRDGGNPRSPFYANYDEAKANPFPNLPDPLVFKSGQKVKTAEMWWHQVLAMGWGYATLTPTNIQPDNGAGLTSGIIGWLSTSDV